MFWLLYKTPGGSLGWIRLGLLNFRFICSLSSLNVIINLKWHQWQIRYRCHYAYCLTFLFISFLDLKFSTSHVLCVWRFHIICVNSIMTQMSIHSVKCGALNQQQILELHRNKPAKTQWTAWYWITSRWKWNSLIINIFYTYEEGKS